MKKLTTVIFFSVMFMNGFASNHNLIADFKNLILQTFTYTDFNPIYKSESDKIQNEFQQILSRRGTIELADDYNAEIDTLFKWIYKNGNSEYDDSPDSRRIKMRRAFCFASIALISDYNKAYTFIEYAKLSIVESIEHPDMELLENQYLGILLIEAMLKMEDGQLRKSDLTKLESYLDEKKGLLAGKNIDEVRSLVEKLTE